MKSYYRAPTLAAPWQAVTPKLKENPCFKALGRDAEGYQFIFWSDGEDWLRQTGGFQAGEAYVEERCRPVRWAPLELVATAGAEPLALAIARTAQDLSLLLDGVLPEAEHMQESGVLTLLKKTLPGLLQSMSAGRYAESGLIPRAYIPASPRPAGWGTFWSLLEGAAMHGLDESPDDITLSYNRGVQWAVARLQSALPAAGADTGGEPLNFKVARKAAELEWLTDQLGPISDDMPAGAVLVLVHFSLRGVVRNMNDGLYIHEGLCPVITNRAYLPPADWAKELENCRQGALGAAADAPNPVVYQYHEAVRWTCAKTRDAFRAFTEAPRERG
jgi:hypothetical protein